MYKYSKFLDGKYVWECFIFMKNFFMRFSCQDTQNDVKRPE